MRADCGGPLELPARSGPPATRTGARELRSHLPRSPAGYWGRNAGHLRGPKKSLSAAEVPWPGSLQPNKAKVRALLRESRVRVFQRQTKRQVCEGVTTNR